MRTTIVFLLAASVASADEVTLKSGKKFGGIAREEGDKVVLEMELGTVGIPKDQVSNVTFGRTPLHDFYDALKACRTVDDFLMVARAQKAARLANIAYAKVVELDPENAEARGKLGHEKVGGRWTTREEREAAAREAEAAAKAKAAEERRAQKRREREEIARIEEEYRRRIAQIESDAGLRAEPYRGPIYRRYPWDYSFFHPRVAPGAAAGVRPWSWTVPRGCTVQRYPALSLRPTVYRRSRWPAGW